MGEGGREEQSFGFMLRFLFLKIYLLTYIADLFLLERMVRRVFTKGFHDDMRMTCIHEDLILIRYSSSTRVTVS